MAYFGSERVNISSVLLIKQRMFPVLRIWIVLLLSLLILLFSRLMRWGFFSPQKNRVKDFREAIIKYLEAMMESQQQVCKLLLCREELRAGIFSGAPCTRKLVKLGALVNSEIEAKSTVPMPLCHPLFHVHFHIAHNTPRLPTRKIWISIVFNLSWDKCDTQ